MVERMSPLRPAAAARHDLVAETQDELLASLRGLVAAAAAHELEHGPGSGLAFISARIEMCEMVARVRRPVCA